MPTQPLHFLFAAFAFNCFAEKADGGRCALQTLQMRASLPAPGGGGAVKAMAAFAALTLRSISARLVSACSVLRPCIYAPPFRLGRRIASTTPKWRVRLLAAQAFPHRRRAGV